jgi:hypothetical protein
MAAPFNLEDHGITVTEIHRNLPPSALYEHPSETSYSNALVCSR